MVQGFFVRCFGERCGAGSSLVMVILFDWFKVNGDAVFTGPLAGAKKNKLALYC